MASSSATMAGQVASRVARACEIMRAMSKAWSRFATNVAFTASKTLGHTICTASLSSERYRMCTRNTRNTRKEQDKRGRGATGKSTHLPSRRPLPLHRLP